MLNLWDTLYIRWGTSRRRTRYTDVTELPANHAISVRRSVTISLNGKIFDGVETTEHKEAEMVLTISKTDFQRRSLALAGTVEQLRTDWQTLCYREFKYRFCEYSILVISTECVWIFFCRATASPIGLLSFDPSHSTQLISHSINHGEDKFRQAS